MPTSYKVKNKLFSLLPMEIKGKIYELGSGWGTLLLLLAEKYPQYQILGLESSPLPFWFSKLRLRPYPNVKVVREDFFSKNLSDTGLVVCYLYPGAMEKLKLKFEAELRPGAVVISNTFAVPGWVPENMFIVNDLYRTKIYFYKY